MGFVKKAAGWASGITPAKKLFGLDPRTVDSASYENPFFQKQYKEDQNRSNFYDNQSQKAFGQMQDQTHRINQQALGYNPLIQHLTDMTNGVGPSLAQMQLEQGVNNNIKNQAAIAGSNPNMNPAMAARLMGQNVASLNQDAAGQAGQLRLQEQMDAMRGALAARQAQGQAYGMAGNLMSNRGQLGLQGGSNYQDMAEMLAERDRQARMGLNASNQAGYNSGQQRRGEFWKNVASGIAGASGGGGAAGGGASATSAGMPQSNGIMPGGGPGLYNY